jgi:hypothetical protein
MERKEVDLEKMDRGKMRKVSFLSVERQGLRERRE